MRIEPMKSMLIIACIISALLAKPAAAQSPQPFRFVHITDSRVSAARDLGPLKKIVTDIKDMSPQPAFVIETGEVTESGKPEEFERFAQATSNLPVTFYAAPGSHDVRWSPTGKEAFITE